ncbi:MAG TPA: hypothetical protein VK949_02995, partial [Methylotenera sp.]|nr:hypothetical protein [Methylotenera sp.]
MIKKLINFLILFVPYGVWKLLKIYSLRGIFRYFKYKNILARNKSLKNIAEKKSRCFILCNGPSVKKQNLLPLKNELVFSVSSGYLHEQYSAIQPHFHCVPQITYGVMSEQDVVDWFIEMDKHLGDSAQLILSISEFDLIQRNQLFKNRKIYYLNLGRLIKDNEKNIIDITKISPVISSVPIMSLIVAMYMGYKEIYLLGTEHDSFKSNQYKY